MVNHKPASKLAKPAAKATSKARATESKARDPKRKERTPLPPRNVPLEIARQGHQVTYNPNGSRPCVMGRNLCILEGARYARRPSKVARREGRFNATEVAWADRYDAPDAWEEAEDLPEEKRKEDCGWIAGPADRELPPFLGPTPGPTDQSLNAESSVEDFLRTQLTDEFVNKVVQYTLEHCAVWRNAHPDWRTHCAEAAVKKPKKQFTANQFYLWLACRLRIAQLKPELPAYSLWDRKSSLFDVQVFAAMTFNQFQWINKHVSFADAPPAPGEDEESEDEEDEVEENEVHDEDDAGDVSDGEEYEHGGAGSMMIVREGDSHRKRRELTNMACEAFGQAWWPHQFLGLDEAVRPHKHWGKQRIRFKAAVHSGVLVDCLNDCVSKYTLWFEEQHWFHKTPEEDPNTVTSRITRAAKVLCDKGSLVSTANYCISLDRGYGHVQAQAKLAEMGIYSSSMMAANRIGLPREFLSELACDLGACPMDPTTNKPCTHGADAEECRRFCFTAMHKPSSSTGVGTSAAAAAWELSLWQDSQMIISYGNFFSSARCGLLARGAHGARESFSVWAPEPIWHYNVQGRSATDGADQLRKKLCIAERRIVRAGVKGISFVFDLAFTNASIMWQYMHRTKVSRQKLDSKYTKVSCTLQEH